MLLTVVKRRDDGLEELWNGTSKVLGCIQHGEEIGGGLIALRNRLSTQSRCAC